MRRAVLIYNPTAGRYPSLMLTERAADTLRKSGWQARLEQTNSGSHITELTKECVQEGVDVVFVVGGDGSINLAVAGLLGSQTALGVLPAGTANVWAQEIGLPFLNWMNWTALDESANLLSDGDIHSVDVGMCNDKPFLLWAGVGLDAYVVHHLEPRSRWEKGFGAVQYAASVLWNASHYRGVHMTVEADNQLVSGQFIIAVMSNVHLYAGGLAELSPNARLNDGVMDTWLFMGDTFSDTVQRAWDLFSGQHIDSQQVTCLPFRSAVLRSDSVLYVHVDGEPALEDHTVRISVLPQALKVLVPKKVPHELFQQPKDANQI